MLVTKQAILRRFWYPVLPIANLSIDRPQAFQLLGEKIVLWRANDKPTAAIDRCCHRTAQLSKGVVIDDCLRCPYHGWSFDRNGICVNVPQLNADQKIPDSYRVKSFPCVDRYGYVWVCLEADPLLPIPDIPEAEDPNLRLIPEFYEPWNCSGLRLMENSFDNAHFSFVHAASFGNQAQPEPAFMQLEPLEFGLRMRSQVPVINPPAQQKNLNLAEAKTVRDVDAIWYMPFMRSLKITYPNGLMHLIFTAATPVNDSTSQVIQFCVRNDTEADAKAAEIIAFDRQVTLEDQAVLETTDFDTPLDLMAEQHIASDQPGIVMRRKLMALLKQHGEVEQTRS